MPYVKHTPMTDLQKKTLREYYANGFDPIKAYCKAKEMEIPKDKKKRKSITAMVSQMKAANPEFLAKLEEKNEKKYSGMKDKLVTQLEEVSSTYQQMVELAMQDELSEEEQAKFNRLTRFMSTRDLNKAVELIGKLTGSFENKKVEVTNTFTVDWGDAPKLQESNAGIIDVDYIEE